MSNVQAHSLYEKKASDHDAMACILDLYAASPAPRHITIPFGEIALKNMGVWPRKGSQFTQRQKVDSRLNLESFLLYWKRALCPSTVHACCVL